MLKWDIQSKWTLLLGLLILLTGLVIGQAIPPLYKWVYPDKVVVKDFILTTNYRQRKEVWVEGTLVKMLACDFQELSAYDVRPGPPSTPLSIDSSPDNVPKSRQLGYQKWGPWIITLLDNEQTVIRLQVRHLCDFPDGSRQSVTSQLVTFSVVGTTEGKKE